MSNPSLTTREKLLQAALTLFTSQGINGTTTRQIAELAAVNEVTLFRHFGHKYGLLQAMIESAMLPQPAALQLFALGQSTESRPEFAAALRQYGAAWLDTLAAAPELVRSIIGEAGQFPPENRRVLGQGLAAIHQDFAAQLRGLDYPAGCSPEALAGLALSLLLGYAVVEFTCDHHPVWAERDQFLADLGQLWAVSQPSSAAPNPTQPVAVQITDLPAPLVQAILQQARKCGLQDYALAYVLFAAGLAAGELLELQRHQVLQVMGQQVIQITPAQITQSNQNNRTRQVPVNQWVWGQRYGSVTNNPLSRWLRSRKDEQSAMFLAPDQQPLTLEALEHLWQQWTVGLTTPTGQPPILAQAQQTWRVEMLSRGISLENLSLLTGVAATALQPYALRAQEILALEQAAQLDRRASKKEA